MSTIAIVTLALLPVIAYIVWIARVAHVPLTAEERSDIWCGIENVTTSVCAIVLTVLMAELLLNELGSYRLWPMVLWFH